MTDAEKKGAGRDEGGQACKVGLADEVDGVQGVVVEVLVTAMVMVIKMKMKISDVNGTRSRGGRQKSCGSGWRRPLLRR